MTLQDLAAIIFESVRKHQRECRCPVCVPHGLQCVECPTCSRNMTDDIEDELRKVNRK